MNTKLVMLILLASCAYNPDNVRYVNDGDTFTLNNGDVIRLAGIDTPEKGDINYDKAAYELQKRIIGRELTFEGTETDDYQRKVRHVFTEGRHVNLELVQEGWARAAWHEGTKYEAILEKAQQEARNARKGIWNVNDESYKRLSHRCAELGCPVGSIAVASKNGNVFYNCACGSTSLIAKENIVCFEQLQDAIAQRLMEARKC